MRTAPAIARLIEVDTRAIPAHVDYVVRARAVDVGHTQAPVIELIRVVEPWSVVHGDLLPEPAIAHVGPVADFPIADPHEVAQAVARHVGEVDRLHAVGEDQPWPLLFVKGLEGALRRREP